MPITCIACLIAVSLSLSLVHEEPFAIRIALRLVSIWVTLLAYRALISSKPISSRKAIKITSNAIHDSVTQSKTSLYIASGLASRKIIEDVEVDLMGVRTKAEMGQYRRRHPNEIYNPMTGEYETNNEEEDREMDRMREAMRDL